MTEILIVLSFGSSRPDDRLEVEPSSESAFLASNASSSRSAVMALFRRPAGGPQIQGARQAATVENLGHEKLWEHEELHKANRTHVYVG